MISVNFQRFASGVGPTAPFCCTGRSFGNAVVAVWFGPANLSRDPYLDEKELILCRWGFIVNFVPSPRSHAPSAGVGEAVGCEYANNHKDSITI